MSKSRLEALSDAIFGIVMTLLIIEIKVPVFKEGDFSESYLWDKILHEWPLFFAFFLSFILLTSMWVSHHFLFSSLAKNINRQLLYLNLILLVFVSFVPFSSSLLGNYSFSRVAVAFYSINLLIIAIITVGIREYIMLSKNIENIEMKAIDRLYGNARMGTNILFPVLAILFSFFWVQASVILLVIGAVVSSIPGFYGVVFRITGLDKKYKSDEI
jgi:uncharacterized membrane protein